MVYIITVVISESLPVIGVITTAIFLSLFAYLHLKSITYDGKDINLMILLSFIVPGLGLIYIGSTKKGLYWFLAQVVGLLLSYGLHKAEVEGYAVGLAIMIPFILQLAFCAKEYREKFGN